MGRVFAARFTAHISRGAIPSNNSTALSYATLCRVMKRTTRTLLQCPQFRLFVRVLLPLYYSSKFPIPAKYVGMRCSMLCVCVPASVLSVATAKID